jgi:hypothetical protein
MFELILSDHNMQKDQATSHYFVIIIITILWLETNVGF